MRYTALSPLSLYRCIHLRVRGSPRLSLSALPASPEWNPFPVPVFCLCSPSDTLSMGVVAGSASWIIIRSLSRPSLAKPVSLPLRWKPSSPHRFLFVLALALLLERQGGLAPAYTSATTFPIHPLRLHRLQPLRLSLSPAILLLPLYIGG